jgi:hypothetical protein
MGKNVSADSVGSTSAAGVAEAMGVAKVALGQESRLIYPVSCIIGFYHVLPMHRCKGVLPCMA